ncbi:hypothetical protein H9P43_006639 [Blastocladiella emersonii ATCC 22665]|nr:hypothetical protein H9P43_006639 [Blastocladiella emersonii ATCC 22665]
MASNLFTLVLKFIKQKLVNNASIASGTWDTAHAAFKAAKAGNMGVLKPAWTNNVLFDAAGNPNTILKVLLNGVLLLSVNSNVSFGSIAVLMLQELDGAVLKVNRAQCFLALLLAVLGSALSPAKGWGDFRNQSDRQSDLTKLRKVVAEPDFTEKVTGFSVLFRETTATPASGLAIAGAPAAASASSSVPAGAVPFSDSGYAVEMPLGNTLSMLINPGNPALPLHLAAHNGLDPGIFKLLTRSGNGSGSASLTMLASTSAAVPLATGAPLLVPVETTTAPFPFATLTSGSVVKPQVGAAHGLTSPAAAVNAVAAAQDPAGVVDGETKAKLRQLAASKGGVIKDDKRAEDDKSAWSNAQVTQETDPTNDVKNAPPATRAKSTRVRKPSAKRAATLAALAISMPRRTKTKAKK